MAKDSSAKSKTAAPRASRKRESAPPEFTVRLDVERAKKRLHWRGSPDTETELTELVRLAESLIEPRVACRVAYVDRRGEDEVTIEGVTFSSRVLRKNLDAVERVFPYVITIGPGLEEHAGACGDPLRQYYLEGLADMALHEIALELDRRLRKRHGLTRIASMAPGSLEDWPITQQPLLFSLFGGPEKSAGVRLTEHMLMVPRKSISGVYFPTDLNFQSCQLCPRKNCHGRRAPYDKELEKKYRLKAAD